MIIHLAIVSHGHWQLIEKLHSLPALLSSESIKIWLLDNVGEKGLDHYCDKHDINYLKNSYKMGFGENNNKIFSHIENEVGFDANDVFLVLNPDIVIDVESILDAVEFAQNEKKELLTISLYKDTEFKNIDCCVRYFPKFLDFFTSYLGLGNKTIIDKSKITEPIAVDWAAGSFLMFKASLFKELGGFDPKYFMYCEDIDICWRSKNLFNQKLIYYPHIKAVHHAQHANRSLLSKHFFWHLKSVFRYLMLYYGLRKPYKIKGK
jgi:GT2 family glycosyltransferase